MRRQELESRDRGKFKTSIIFQQRVWKECGKNREAERVQETETIICVR